MHSTSSSIAIKATLLVSSGPKRGQSFPLGSDRTLLGRLAPCDVILPSSGVSRQHALIRLRDEGFFLEDLGSLNGTFINGERIQTPQLLQSGDTIQIHDTLLLFSLPRSKPAAGLDQSSPTSDRPPSVGTSVVAALDVRCGAQSRVEVNAEIKLRALLDIIRSVGVTSDIDHALGEVLDDVLAIFPQADHGYVLLYDAEQNRLVPRAVRHRQPEVASQTLGPISDRVAFQALHEGKALLSADHAGHGAISQGETVFDLQLRAIMCAPLISPATSALGVLQLVTDDSQRQFAQADLDVLASIGQLAGQLVEYARGFERKGAQDALRHSESRFRALVEKSWDSISVVNSEATFEYTMAAVKRHLGYEPKELIGRNSLELVHPDDLPRIASLFKKLVAEPGTSQTAEHRTLHRDGTWRWMEGTGTNLLHDPAVAGIVLNYRDVTARRKVEEALRQSQERLQIAMEAAKLGSWQRNLETQELECSETCKANFGRSANDPFTYDDFLAAIHPEDRETVHNALREALAGPGDYQAEYRTIWPDGSIHWIVANGRVLQGDHHEPRLMVGVMLDITSRKQIEEERARLLLDERRAREEAERLSRVKDEFLATLSHELRTPLNAIVGWADLLQTGTLQKVEISQGLETIQRNAQLQTQIIEDLLDMSRIISGQIRLDIRPLQVSALVDAAIETAMPAAKNKEVELQVFCNTSLWVHGDSARLQQVLWNLLSNAIKFTLPGGSITVSAIHKDSQIELSVRDSGEGIEPNFLPHVFERFRQADSSATRRHGGLGLGLAIVKQIVELHGGSVRATSVGVGQGSTFSVLLPNKPAGVSDQASDVGASEVLIGEANLLGLDVLVVEDEADSREVLRRILFDLGAHVKCVDSAQAALDIIQNQPPAVLVADLAMPVMDGYELIKRVRALPQQQARSLPAVAVTAFAHAEARQQSVAAGYQVHLAKPVNRTELLSVLTKLVRRNRTS